MAVELGLNRYVPNPSSGETEFQRLERRNRERTYLVLFVHDRSLSTQTGRHWMLPEDDLVRHSMTWHEEGGSTMRPEDIIVAAFVALRRIAVFTFFLSPKLLLIRYKAETTDVFNASKGAGPGVHHDVNYEVVLRNCNAKLTQWADTWQHEMDRGISFTADTSKLTNISMFSGRGKVPLIFPEFFPPTCQAILEQLRHSGRHVTGVFLHDFICTEIRAECFIFSRAARVQAFKLSRPAAQAPWIPYGLFPRTLRA